MHFRQYGSSVLISLFLTTLSWGQKPSAIPDSLLRYLKTAKQDTTYVRAANQYTWWLINPLGEYDRADSLLKRTEALAKRLNDPMGLQRIYFHLGKIRMHHPFVKYFPESLPYFQKAHQVVQKAHLPPSELQRVLSALGQYYFYDNQFETALPYFLAAIRLTEQYKLTDYVTRAYIGAGEVMGAMDQHKEMARYYQKAYSIAYQDQDKGMIVWAEERMAGLLQGQHKYKKALAHLNKGLTYANSYSSKTYRITLWSQISHCYEHLGQDIEALYFLKKSERDAPSVGPGAEYSAYAGLGNYYLNHKQYQLAETYFKKATRVSEENKELMEQLLNAHDLVRLYAETRQFEKAFQNQVKINTLDDSLFSNQTAQKIRDLETRHEIEKRETQIKLLNQQKQNARFQRNAYLIGAGFLLILILLLATWLLNRARLRRLQEAQSLRQQIAHDLHDEVGSTLSSISLLSGMTDKLLTEISLPTDESASAQRMVKKIYSDARQILESVDEIIWTINPGNDSLHRIALRLQEYAQPLMESKQIDFNFSVGPALDQLPVSMEVRRNLFLIGKEAINNLVKYSQATQATLRFDHHNGQINVLIEDNGRGFDVAQPSQRTGQASMQQRAKAMGGVLEIHSAPGQGTRLHLLMHQ
ncbi:tetratricopeptide repeat-containing sensor histidine kinase [Spirosoma areae]